MPVIGQQAFILAPTTDKYLSLTNEEFVRQLDLTGFGNNWQRIRIAVNCSFANTGGGNLTNFALFMGLCSGTTFPFGSQQCVHAAGYCWGDPTTGTQASTYVAGAGNPYYSGGLSIYGIRKVGVTWTTATVGSATWTHIATGGLTERRGWMCVDIAQNATQVLPGGKSESTAVSASDVYYNHFVYATGQGGIPTVLEATAANNSQTLSPGAGWNTNVLNTVNILWRSPSYEMRIYAISVCFIP